MKKFIYSLSILLSALSFTACNDYFDPETDDELPGDKYISSDTEMFTGFLGIITNMQKVGDKEIFLTDTRGELLEVTDRSIPELISIYNYDNDLTGNSYADPATYYDVIIACNDYLVKMHEYRHTPGVDDQTWQNLVSSTVRIKVWAYKTLAEIYGEAVWFDSPVTEYTEITPANGFYFVKLEELIDRCYNLLETGFDGVSTRLVIDWRDILAPDLTQDTKYRNWNFVVPPFEGLCAELALWKAACIESHDPDATTSNPEALPYYKRAADLLLAAINVYVNDSGKSGNPGYWLPNSATGGKYCASNGLFGGPTPFENGTVSAITYDYTQNQVNRLFYHFSNEYPNKYLLRPSQVGMDRFIDSDFNPGTSTNESRYKGNFGRSSGQYYIAKYRSVGSSVRVNPYQDDHTIYIYRTNQYHLMLAEALNHLKRFTACSGVFNDGVKKEIFVDGAPEWEGFTRNWTGDAEWGTRSYPSAGLHMSYCNQARKVVTSLVGTTEHDAIRFNDMQMLDECMMEFICEGKIYPMMNRMAVRYGDLSIVADRVCPKYVESGKDSEIRAKIMAGANWVKYDLQVVGQDLSSLAATHTPADTPDTPEATEE